MYDVVPDCASGFVTLTVTVPAACTGAVAVRLVLLLNVTPMPFDVSNFTVAPLTKFAPLIATIVPPFVGPLDGLSALIVGAAACTWVTVNVPPMIVWPTPHDDCVQIYENVP